MQMRSAIAAVLSVGMLSAGGGCFWLAVGGAGAVGYQVGKDDRTLGTKVDDASITSAVKTRFIGDSDVQAIDINVDTYEGVVTLHGHVDSAGQVKRAIALAKSVKGVTRVDSELVVLPPASD